MAHGGDFASPGVTAGGEPSSAAEPTALVEAPTRGKRWFGLAARTWDVGASIAEFLFGYASLVVLLAMASAAPIVQFVAFGVILDSVGRTARSGRFRDAFFAVRPAARLGGTLLALWLLSLPVRFLRSMLADARLVDPSAPATRGVEAAVLLVAGAILVHVALAVGRGGRLRHFVRPIQNVRWLVQAARAGKWPRGERPGIGFGPALAAAWDWFVLGVLGFLATALWLFIPATLLAAGRENPGLGWIGGVLMTFVVLFVPAAQMRFVAEGRFRAAFEVRAIRRHIAAAPIAFLFGMILLVPFAVPLYLLKIESIPPDVVWLPTILFVALALPLKLCWAWAYARGGRRDGPARWWIRWPCRLATIPIAAVYVFFVFLSQYTTWAGALGLYEHHAFLLPAPF